MRFQHEAFDVQVGIRPLRSGILDVHDVVPVVAQMFGLITAAFGGDVDQRRIQVGQKLQLGAHRKTGFRCQDQPGSGTRPQLAKLSPSAL